MDDRDILQDLFAAALEAASPAGKFAGRLPAKPAGRTIVIGAGKAAASMAQAFEAAWPHPCEGLVITRYGHGLPQGAIRIVEAAHPVPDAAGLEASREMLALASSASRDDLVVCLMSGGASSLLTLPANGLTLSDKQALNRALLACGAPISAMNEVRKAVSAVKGGRLAAAAAPARLVTYIISDVPGDDPATVGSGPTIPQRPDPDRVKDILKRYAIDMPQHVRDAIDANAKTAATGQGGDVHVIATAKMALDAAAARARTLGIHPLILGDAIEGEAREVGIVMAGIARSAARYGEPAARPCVLLSGGETTVTVRGNGRGGRNAEFLLSLALALDNAEGICALAADTDGIDGSQDNAGAWFDAQSLQILRAKKADFQHALATHDSYGAFLAMKRLLVTGPTRTNVNDFRAILVR